LFRQAIEKAGSSEFVFPGERGASHIASRSVSNAMARTRAKLKIKDITMHDLRRTAGTFMSQLSVPKHVRERILNHGGKRKGSLTEGVYNLYEYDAEKRAALELWADALDCIVKSDFPKPRRISRGRVAWVEEEISVWIASHIEATHRA
jgi:integrase